MEEEYIPLHVKTRCNFVIFYPKFVVNNVILDFSFYRHFQNYKIRENSLANLMYHNIQFQQFILRCYHVALSEPFVYFLCWSILKQIPDLMTFHPYILKYASHSFFYFITFYYIIIMLLQWPQDWKRSVFIPIPKKGNAKQCSNYHTTVLISC